MFDWNVGKEDLKHHTCLTDISSQSDLRDKRKIILIATQLSLICVSHSGPVKARLRCVNRLRVWSFFLTIGFLKSIVFIFIFNFQDQADEPSPLKSDELEPNSMKRSHKMRLAELLRNKRQKAYEDFMFENQKEWSKGKNACCKKADVSISKKWCFWTENHVVTHLNLRGRRKGMFNAK